MKITTNVPERPALIANVDKFYKDDRIELHMKDGHVKTGILTEIFPDYVTVRGGDSYEDYKAAQTVILDKVKAVRPADRQMPMGQVETERGILFIEASYQSEERAKMDGYDFAFHSSKLGCDLYSKCLDDRGLRHSFAVIEGYC